MFPASSKLSVLFNCPLSLFHHRPSTLLRLHHHHSLTYPLAAVPHHLLHSSRSNSYFPIKSSQQFNSQSTSNSQQENNHTPADDAYLVPASHPWPELLQLLESISVAGYSDVNRNIKDEFVTNESLSMQFVDAACYCLSFAHDRPDILGWLPKDDIHVLINNGAPFLFKSAIKTEKTMRSFLQGGESSEATTVDLMKYILSYASNPIIHPERNINEASETSARNLLRKMALFIGRAETSGRPVIEKVNGPEEDEKTPTNIGSNIIMKRGEWICRKCNFFNHGRNITCIKCECTRPGGAPLPAKINSGYAPFVPLPPDMFAKKPENNTNSSNKTMTINLENSEKSKFNDIVEKEKSERWFKKVGELDDDVTDLTSDIIDDDFPDIMPIRKGENRFVVSKKKDRSSTYKRQQAFEQGGNNGNFVPFVPFPPDYFAKKDDNRVQETRNTEINGSENNPETLNGDRVIPENQKVRNGSEGTRKTSNGEQVILENPNLRNGLLINDTNLTEISGNGNKPEMLIGDRVTPENRKVRNGSEGTRKTSNGERIILENPNLRNGVLIDDTNLTEMSGNGNKPETLNGDRVIPENRKVRNGSEGTRKTSNGERVIPENPNLRNGPLIDDVNLVQETRNTEISGNGNKPEMLIGDRVTPEKRNVRNGSEGTQNTEMNRSVNRPETSNDERVKPETWNFGNGSSLEGSAVKETDPLDMSEEAKAERWFRRVAQIKDISELSQIPDEDFPSIMPMRKGVNRFVVSKRKTPLERRLTSPQYRKDVRPAGSEPVKNEGEES